MAGPDDADFQRIDDALAAWQQGDCAVGEHWFLFQHEPSAPLTEAAVAAVEAGSDAAESEVRGLMVASQTCDVVRSCRQRPYIEVCPLVEVDEEALTAIQRGRHIRYGFVPGVSDELLVADLDRVMTVEKPVVLEWDRVRGCPEPEDLRYLQFALARKRARTAFPDDFVKFAEPLTRRMSSKHDKASGEGRALQALREIRVRAAPSWDAPEVDLIFWFIPGDDDSRFEGSGWDDWLEKWLKLVPAAGRFISVAGIVQMLDDMTARDYVESDPLDLDHLTLRDP